MPNHPAERFANRVAVVTGGASGIGLAITRRLVAEGARVVVADVNPQSLAEASAEFGPAIATANVDVRIEAQVESMTETAIARFGGLDIAFNCAGLGTPAPIVDLREEDWDLTVDVCLKGVFLAVKHEGRRMIALGRGGAIVNVASLNSHVPMFGGAAYTCAKAGVEMLSRNAALELAEHRIRVNTVSPGLTETPLTAPLKSVAGAYDAYLARIPLRRVGTPQDMAAAALFLASDDASYVSGANLFVDGGWETTGYPDLRPFLGQLVAAR